MKPKTPDLATPVHPLDHCQGAAGAKVTLVEYGDYQCAACCQAFNLIRNLPLQPDGRLQLVFRHFPRVAVHRLAQLAAEATEAAHAQGKFWPMHDLLCSRRSEFTETSFVQYAAILNLDVHRFQLELTTHVHAARVAADVLSGRQSGVMDTPAFFLNGYRFHEPWINGNLQARLEELLGQ